MITLAVHGLKYDVAFTLACMLVACVCVVLAFREAGRRG